MVAAKQTEMKIINRVSEVPMVELALEKSISTYKYVKDSHYLVNWLLLTAESTLTSASKQAAPLTIPIVNKLQKPISFVDNSLCLGFDKIEQNVPFIKEKPDQILEHAYMFAVSSIQPTMSKISYANEIIKAQTNSIKDVSWNKINEVLKTYYGTAAVNGVDSAAEIADKLIDRYFPAIEDEKLIEPISAEEDQLLHTLQTVGRLSNKAAKRVYSHVVSQLDTVVHKNHLRIYIDLVMEFLKLTHYVEKVHNTTQPENNPENNDIAESNMTNIQTSDKSEKLRSTETANDSSATTINPEQDIDEEN